MATRRHMAIHRARAGVSLVRAGRELAACVHPRAQVRWFYAVPIDEDTRARRMRRCADCGAVRFDGERRWTRPMLVAHVVGATP